MTPNEIANLLYDYAGAVQDFFIAFGKDDEDQIRERLIDLDAMHVQVVDALDEIFKESETEH